MQFRVKGILSFPTLFDPRAIEGGVPKFSTSILVRKDDPQMANILAIVETDKKNGFPNGFPPKGRVFVKDCAVERTENATLANYYEIRANCDANNRPTVVDHTGAPVMDRALVYPGCIAWVSLNTFAYNKEMNKGIGCGLNGVLITGEMGELGRLDNKPGTESMFGDLLNEGAPMAAAPAAPPHSAAPPRPAAPSPYQMTDKAQGFTRDQYIAQGWTDQQLIEAGMMLPPVQTSF